MLEKLVHIDQVLLLTINGWHAPWADSFFWYVSKMLVWIPLYLMMVYAVVHKYRNWRQILVVLTGFALAIVAADQISSGLIKPLVERLRPTHEPAIKGAVHLVRDYTGGLYGFVSSHAANTMAAGLLFCLLMRKPWITTGMIIWVALNCYSRMYLGVHYPGDILGGLIVGTVVALGVNKMLVKVLPLLERPKPNPSADHAD